MEDTRRDNDGTVNIGGQTDVPVDETKKAFVQKPGAIRIYDGAISTDFCDDLIELFEKNTELHELKEDGTHKFHQYNYTKHHQEEEIHGELMKHIGNLFKQYLGDIGTGLRFKPSGFEELRIKKYRANTEDKFDVHIDVTDHQSAIRACAFLFYLNDNDGNTDFLLQYLGVEPRKGRVVIFPPTWEYPHIGNKPTTNDKYIMSTYLHYA